MYSFNWIVVKLSIGKIHVVLLEQVPNIGQSGDVVFVSSAIFQNQLKRKRNLTYEGVSMSILESPSLLKQTEMQ